MDLQVEKILKLPTKQKILLLQGRHFLVSGKFPQIICYPIVHRRWYAVAKFAASCTLALCQFICEPGTP